MTHVWTDDMDGKVRAWRAEGITFIEIARRLGRDFSKDMVIGRSHRLQRMPLRPVKVEVPVRLTKPLGQPAELLELDPDGCKWGVAEDPSHLHRHKFCNAHRIKDRAYCERHWRQSIGPGLRRGDGP